MLIISDIHTRKNSILSIEAVEAELASDTDNTIIVTGDITHKAKSEEYERITSWFVSLLDRGVGIVVTSGNHDITKRIPVLNLKSKSGRKRYAFLIDMIAEQSIVVARKDSFDLVYRISNDVFCALRSTHGKLYKGLRIKKDQYEWASGILLQNGFIKSNGFRFHLVTHHSLWESEDDRHGHMNKRKRLAKKFLCPFEFSTAINGHNHRFHEEHQSLKGKCTLYHIQAPTLSEDRTKGRFQAGFVKWNPEKENSAFLISV